MVTSTDATLHKVMPYLPQLLHDPYRGYRTLMTTTLLSWTIGRQSLSRCIGDLFSSCGRQLGNCMCIPFARDVEGVASSHHCMSSALDDELRAVQFLRFSGEHDHLPFPQMKAHLAQVLTPLLLSHWQKSTISMKSTKCKTVSTCVAWQMLVS